MFKVEDVQNSTGEFGSKKEMYQPGVNIMTITELKPWEDKTKGFGIRFKGNLEKTLYLGFSYQYNVNEFTNLIKALKIDYKGKILPKDFVHKQVGVDIELVEKTGYIVNDDLSVFTLKEFNEKTGNLYGSNEEVPANVKFTFQQEEIKGFEITHKTADDHLDDFEAGFSLDDDVQF